MYNSALTLNLIIVIFYLLLNDGKPIIINETQHNIFINIFDRNKSDIVVIYILLYDYVLFFITTIPIFISM